MAETKQAEGSVTLLNRGRRNFDLGNDGKGSPRGKHAPGTTHTYTAEDAKKLEGYSDLVDITKLPGQVDVKKIQAENVRLLDENRRLKEQLAAVQPSDPEPKGDGRRKKERAEAGS